MKESQRVGWQIRVERPPEGGGIGPIIYSLDSKFRAIWRPLEKLLTARSPPFESADRDWRIWSPPFPSPGLAGACGAFAPVRTSILRRLRRLCMPKHFIFPAPAAHLHVWVPHFFGACGAFSCMGGSFCAGGRADWLLDWCVGRLAGWMVGWMRKRIRPNLVRF